MKKNYQRLRLILGDQLDIRHSWFDEVQGDTLYVIAELKQETGYVRHHVQKVCCFFLAMQKFAGELERKGHDVLYLDLDETADFNELPGLLDNLIDRFDVAHVEYQIPDEYRLEQQLAQYGQDCSADVSGASNKHFYLQRDELPDYFPKDKNLVMETFYRNMRRRFDILMEGDKPVGGRWNYDTENRKKLPKNVDVPAPRYYKHDVADILDRLRRHDIETIGRVPQGPLSWPVTRREALALVDDFCKHRLNSFGKYQDAMTDRGWALFHSRLSFSLNTKLIGPDEVVDRVVETYEQNPDDVPLAAVEGFVRQILGWREFMRGVYWTFMPDYETRNSFNHQASLPGFYWTGETQMKCMKTAIDHSLDHAYSHHIQRLMVTGNFALLLGVNPDEVDEWYLGIYADALQWVEITNTRGMSQFADGGIVATKPYISSGKYIQRMSDHCAGCHYDVSKRSGDSACPFNVFFWDFLARHEERLKKNHRMGMMMKNLERIPATELDDIRATARGFRQRMDSL